MKTLPRKLLSLVTAVSLLALAACVTPGSLRIQNRANLARLSLGMSKEQVLAVMGSKRSQDITNPYRTESHRGADGTVWEILFYYTDIKAQDGSVEEGELTPVVFKGDKLEGWGWSYWESTAQTLNVRIRR